MIDLDRDIDADRNQFDQIYPSLQSSRRNQYYDTEEFNGLASDLSQRDFSVMHLNIDSVRANGDSLLSFLSTLNHKFYIICSTEIRVGDLEQADAVFENDTSYSSNRVNRRGGGAEIFILTNIISELETNLTVNLPHIEAFSLKLLYQARQSLYRPFIDNRILMLMVLKHILIKVYCF